MALTKNNLAVDKLKTATDEEILDAYDVARGNVSYYYAAEEAWSRETKAREAAELYKDVVSTELNNRGLTARAGNYLC